MNKMLIENFNYTKDNGEESNRSVLVLHKNKEFIDTIDFGKLSQDEKDKVIEIQEKYLTSMSEYLTKAFRRFKIKNMTNIKEEKDGKHMVS